ncbi:MAG: metallophosphoesterase family protein [Desulfobacterales bacterium]
MAVISDIHGNLEAFKQVLINIDGSDVDRIVCLGDIIGYGPEPEQVVTMINDHHIPSILGNHELAVIDQNYLTWFNPLARRSLLKTIGLLSKKAIHYISKLKPFMIYDEYRFVHGFPPDSPTTYLFQIAEDELLRTFKQMKEKICFVGHTHRLEIINFNGTSVTRSPLTRSIVNLNRANRYIVNIGSVGQPRDGDNHAKYIILDTEKNNIEVKCISYDIASVVNKIIAAGFPTEHAIRLL